jgi:hypothetical protein
MAQKKRAKPRKPGRKLRPKGGLPEWPEEPLPEDEYRRQLRDGLVTLRAECGTRDPDSKDPELLGRFLVLYELMFFGAPAKPQPGNAKPFKKFGAREIAAACTYFLRKEGLEKNDS